MPFGSERLLGIGNRDAYAVHFFTGVDALEVVHARAVSEPAHAAIHHHAVAVGAACGDSLLPRAVQDLTFELDEPQMGMIKTARPMANECRFHCHYYDVLRGIPIGGMVRSQKRGEARVPYDQEQTR